MNAIEVVCGNKGMYLISMAWIVYIIVFIWNLFTWNNNHLYLINYYLYYIYIYSILLF